MSLADRRILRSNLYPMIKHTLRCNKNIASWKEALTMMHYYSISSVGKPHQEWLTSTFGLTVAEVKELLDCPRSQIPSLFKEIHNNV
jgi:hypothetical protein